MKVNQNNEKFVPTEEQIKAECQQRARYFWNWLTWSLVYYVVINLFLVAVNWFTSPHYWWVLWVTQETAPKSTTKDRPYNHSHHRMHNCLL